LNSYGRAASGGAVVQSRRAPLAFSRDPCRFHSFFYIFELSLALLELRANFTSFALSGSIELANLVYTDIFKIELSMLNSNFQREQNELSRLNSILWLNSIFRTRIDLNRLSFLDQKSI